MVGMEPAAPTHSDIVVVLSILISLVLIAFVWGFYVTREIHRGVKEGQRMTKAVAGLVVQESDRIRALMRD